MKKTITIISLSIISNLAMGHALPDANEAQVISAAQQTALERASQHKADTIKRLIEKAQISKSDQVKIHYYQLAAKHDSGLAYLYLGQLTSGKAAINNYLNAARFGYPVAAYRAIGILHADNKKLMMCYFNIASAHTDRGFVKFCDQSFAKGVFKHPGNFGIQNTYEQKLKALKVYHEFCEHHDSSADRAQFLSPSLFDIKDQLQPLICGHYNTEHLRKVMS